MNDPKVLKVAIIGGGAAGFFAALSVKEHHPDAQVMLFEKTSKLLSKVKISGGGRCNVTNSETKISELIKAYPRGAKLLKKAFHVFSTRETMNWFEKRGVRLKTEKDGRIFPISDDSQTVIDCLLRETRKLHIEIRTSSPIEKIESIPGGFLLHTKHEQEKFNKVIIASGGSPKREGLSWLEKLGHEIVEPVPSLFTFNLPSNPITELMGVVSDQASVSIQGSKLKSAGPLLITHWGLSGPAILKLSAFGARLLSEKNYEFKVQVNWTNGLSDEQVLGQIETAAISNPNKQLANLKLFGLPERLWLFLLTKADLPEVKKWGELGKKGMNKLMSVLVNDIYLAKGKTTFKEEFVTCGGVSLRSIHAHSLESKSCSGLYFAGEVLDIDGVTGGYNFQAAWTTGFIAGQLTSH